MPSLVVGMMITYAVCHGMAPGAGWSTSNPAGIIVAGSPRIQRNIEFDPALPHKRRSPLIFNRKT
jgi:hypothetical protein